MVDIIPKAPPHLDDVAAERWNKFWSNSSTESVTPETHSDIVALYCVEYSTWVQAQSTITRAGLLARGANGRVQVNPLVQVRDTASSKMESLGRRLGLEPGVFAKECPNWRLVATSLPEDEELIDAGDAEQENGDAGGAARIDTEGSEGSAP